MLREWQAFQRVAKAFAEGEVCLRIAGLAPPARALVVSELLQAHPRAAIVVVRSMADAHRFTQDLRFYGAPVLEFPEREPRLWRGGRQREADAERAVIARRLLAGEPLWSSSRRRALDTTLPAPADFCGAHAADRRGRRLERELLLESFEAAGYERAETVVEVGQWSVRGGIVDVFAPSHPSPVRLEFFGDDVESIRPVRSRPRSDRPTPSTSSSCCRSARRPMTRTAPRACWTTSRPTRRRSSMRRRCSTRPRTRRRTAGRCVPCSATGRASSWGRWRVPASRSCSTRRRCRGSRRSSPRSPMRSGAGAPRASRCAWWRATSTRPSTCDRSCATTTWRRPSSRRSTRRSRSRSWWGECSAGFMISRAGAGAPHRGRDLRRPPPHARAARKYQRGAALTAFTDLAVSDLVVHEDHGIGRYLGLRTMSVGERDGDFLLLEYAEGGRLYVPGRAARPDLEVPGRRRTASAKLDRLGGASWQRVKESVRAALREMAEGLLKLYAPARGGGGPPLRDRHAVAARVRGGVPLRGDARPAARDRGGQARHGEPAADGPPGGGDVGYGKTEVALRAAFKAVARRHAGRGAGADDGARAAALDDLPERFAPFPVARRAALALPHARRSRRRWWRACAEGAVDVVIGTHRLLSKDVRFKDLGLLVIDEEHRFGVAHKERMKQLARLGRRADADGDADPAHALHGALRRPRHVGDRDAAARPPADRDHRAAASSEASIKEAIERELERGGQVFFVHNRVAVARRMTRLVQRAGARARASSWRTAR